MGGGTPVNECKKLILVVDDNRLNRSILTRILHADGYDTLEAENGQEAFDLMRSGRHEISLLLLDISMPVMDGYTLLQKMNDTSLISTLPVIVTTGNEDASAEIRCLESGASDFLRKPYNAELVRHRVQSMLRLWDNAALINRLEFDRLTGVYSKEFFYRYAEEALAADSEGRYAIVYTDIDDFKMINAHYGTAVGDDLLRFLGRTLRATAGEGGLCGRFDGDAFTLLLHDPRHYTQEEVGRLLTENFAGAPVEGFQLKAGVYNVADRSLSVADMCDRAKLAVGAVKHRYGQYYAVYDDSLQKRAMREHQIVNCMEDALAQEQFLVYLQPKHSVENGTVAGAEALVRWIHPTLGFISPGDFIPLFERNGFIAKLDYYMWEKVCRVLRRWLDEGRDAVPISVNASRADFAQPNLARRIENLVDSYGVPHDLIHFEVTESAYTDQPQQIIGAVQELRSCGFLIEMDDFGSGYSSLNMLSELPIDILKLDMRFMQSGVLEAEGGSRRNVLSFIVSLSKWLQLPTVAEGVERQEEFDLLQAMGCNYIQGYYFAKPMPVQDFEEYLNAHNQPAVTAMPEPALTLLEADADAHKPLVLVVEDVESNRLLLQELLAPHYRVATAENGRVACEYLQSHRGAVDCMLLDLLMPVMDGFEVMEVMRADGSINEVPVIITTEAGPDNELHALRLGAADFLAKPYNAELLLYHVHKVTEEKSFYRLRREFEKESRSLYEMAYQDNLTGLLNRHGLKKSLAELNPGTPYAVVALDVDNLKRCNNTRGHAVGDTVLQGVARRLFSALRSGDILARIGGDEFVAILRGVSDGDTARELGRRLCAAAHSPAGEPCVACSGGVAVASGSDLAAIMRRADVALYQAKQQEKGCCVLWNEGMSIPE